MPRRDVYHQTVIDALTADGWVITDDPLILTYGGRDLYMDIGAEDTISAERAGKKIGVEIKSFVGASDVHDLEVALGQYTLYRDILSEIEPDRSLYLAIPRRVHDGIFTDPLGQLIIRRQHLQLIVFDEAKARIAQWIP